MTKTQLRKKFNELRRRAAQDLDILCEKAIKSGALDLTAYEDSYILPRIVLKAALLNEADQWITRDRPEDEKTVKNLLHFL